MSIQTLIIKRGTNTFTEVIGIDNGKSIHYIDESELDEATGQPVRWVPIRTIIERKGLGDVSWIRTTWGRNLIGANGELILGTQRMDSMFSNAQDIVFFIMGLGLPIMRSEGNGFIRRIKGFNKYPQWNSSTGLPITYTPEQEIEEPTNNYDA